MLVKIVRMSGDISIVGGLLCSIVGLIFFQDDTSIHVYIFVSK